MRKALFILAGGLVFLGCQVEEEEGGAGAQTPRFALATNYTTALVALPDSASPQMAGEIPQATSRLLLVGDTLFWTYSDDNLLGAYDVSDPSSPASLFSDSVPVPGNVDFALQTVRVFGDYLYAPCRGFGMALYRLSGGPQLVWFADSLPAEDCLKDGNYLYVVSGTPGWEFYVLNVSDPENPFLVARIDTAPCGDHIVKVGNYLYVSGWPEGGSVLSLYDVSDPTAPQFVAKLLQDAGDVNGLFLVGDTLYAVGDQLYVLDVSDPANPQLVGQTQGDYHGFTSRLHEVFVSGRYAYVAATLESDSYILVFDLSDPTAPQEVARLEVPGLEGTDIAPLP